MPSRREFLVGVCATVLMTSGIKVHAQDSAGHVRGVTAITRVYGGGQRLVAVAVEYDRNLVSSALEPDDFAVEGRTITRVYANTSADLAEAGHDGPFAVIELSPGDAGAALYVQKGRDIMIRAAEITVAQAEPITAEGGEIAGGSAPIANTAVKNLVVDDFVQRTYEHASGRSLTYNLFVPKGYDPAKRYPLVNFMHDAGVTGSDPMRTLVQGNGAVIWAEPTQQAKHEAFVIAPQFPEQFVNDSDEEAGYLDVVVDLIRELSQEFSIDTNRLYTTGQSGGGMLSIAIMIKYPKFFAAAYLVACQWGADKVRPLTSQKMWVVVSQGDAKAYPGQNTIMEVLEAEGAKVARAVWPGTSTPEQFGAAVISLEAEGAPINYVALRKGTVVPDGQEDSPGANHVNTWRIAYDIEGVRDWLFRQSKA
ncbi:prolyl oligopeptidase family serine peptidase [Agrobacterium tumefaciens]|uniref:prolyl oligopeptidase family serine peptidase n=1 Tax=Agrobacterium tumefaciens TaxID=358 RepID=UPI001B8A42C3|nr:PHB depolymerase family esterase [Agrobacterium tumefaciens]